MIFTFRVILQLHALLSSYWLYYYHPFAGSTEIKIIDDDSVEGIKKGRLTNFIFCSIFFQIIVQVMRELLVMIKALPSINCFCNFPRLLNCDMDTLIVYFGFILFQKIDHLLCPSSSEVFIPFCHTGTQNRDMYFADGQLRLQKKESGFLMQKR